MRSIGERASSERLETDLSYVGSTTTSTTLVLAVGLLLFAASQWLAFSATIQPDNISLFWPQAGVLLVVFLLLPKARWVIAAVTFFVATVVTNLLIGRDIGFGTILSLNDVFVTVVTAALYQHWNGRQPPTRNIGSFWKFIGVVAGGAVLSATIGGLAVSYTFGTAFTAVWPFWFGAMCLGLLIVTPTTILASRLLFNKVSFTPNLEAIFVAASCGLLLVLSFNHSTTNISANTIMSLLLVPSLLWSAVRLSALVACLLLFLVTCADVIAATKGYGSLTLLHVPFATQATWFVIRAGTILLLVADKAEKDSLENARSEQSARMTAIVDTSNDGIISITEKGIVETFNRSAERLFGFEAGEVIGHNVKMLMPDYYKLRHDGYLERYLQTGERRIIGIGRVVSGQRKDGSTFPMELSIGEVQDGLTHAFVGFIRDISERQQSEQRLHELQDELLHVSRLSAMGEMASALAHELNQPLTAIKNYSQASKLLFEKKSRHSELPSVLTKVIDQAERAGQIIRKLRAFVTPKELEVEPESVDQIIEEACALALIGAKQDGIRTIVERGDAIPLVEVDRIQIQQILINLIRNAVDAMRETKKRELTIRTHKSLASVFVDVIDTGPGLRDGVEAHLFKPFMTTKATGMGVGLSISRTIAEAHGGSLHYSSNPKGGAIFTLTLPISRKPTE
jgi:two-component system sensor kinase FixL